MDPVSHEFRLNFNTNYHLYKTITVPHANDSVTPSDLLHAMNEIILSDVIPTAGFGRLTHPRDVERVTTIRDNIDI